MTKPSTVYILPEETPWQRREARPRSVSSAWLAFFSEAERLARLALERETEVQAGATLAAPAPLASCYTPDTDQTQSDENLEETAAILPMEEPV